MEHLLTPESARPLRAVVYTRLSVWGGETDASTSPERQRQVCEDYAKSQGWEVVDVIEDLNVSGSDKGLRLNRPGLSRVRAAFDDVDVVIFAKLDRLARSVVDFNTFAAEAREHDVALVSVAEKLDLSAPMGRFIANLLAAFAEMEAATIAERARAGMAGAVAQGRWRGGATPLGYRAVPHPAGRGFALAIDEDEAAMLRRIVDELLRGTSPYAVCHKLNEEGHRTRRGAQWNTVSLRHVVANPANCGYMVHRGAVIRDDDGMPVRLWEPILDDATWQRARALVLPQSKTQRRRHRTRLLSGLCRCGSCGKVMTAGVLSNGTPCMRCNTRNSGIPCKTSVSIRAEELEAHVTSLVLDLLGDLPVIRIEEVDDDSELAIVEAAIAETAHAMTAPDADLDVLAPRLRALHARRAGLYDAPRRATTRTVSDRTFRDLWNRDDSVDARRELLSDVIAAITVHPVGHGNTVPVQDRITITWSADTNAEEAS